MARFTSIRRLVAGAALFLGMSASAVGLLGQTAHAAPARASIYAVLTGTWLGNALTGPGRCGPAYGQFTFFRNGEYAYTQNDDYNEGARPPQMCGGFTNAGYYRVQNGVITLHWVECNFPCAPGTVSASFRFVGSYNSFEIADGGQAFYYHRQ